MASFISCKKEKIAKEDNNENLIYGVNDPVKDLKWLNDEFKQFKAGPKVDGIVLYKYNDQYVIEVQNSLFSSTNTHQYYCNGTKLDLENPEKFMDFRENSTVIKVLYGINLWKQLNL